MEQISITNNLTGVKTRLFTKEPFCTVKSAIQEKNLMGDDVLKLSIVSSQLLNFGKGDYVTIDGEVYTVRTPATRQIISDNYYQYDVVLYGAMYDLMKCLYRNADANGRSSKSSFDLTYSLKEFAKVIIYNMNRDYPGKWVLDEANVPETEPKTINFASQNCLQVLQTICNDKNFNYDFQITQDKGVSTIHIGKFGSVIAPPGGGNAFEWGKGSGIYDLKEEKVDDNAIKTRLWVEGGTSNLKADYRNFSDRLQLPFPRRLNKKTHTMRDGTVIQANSQMIGIEDDIKRYHEDDVLTAKIGADEEYKSYDEIYPKRTGSITALVPGDINSFVDSSMDFNLNEKDADGNTKYLIGGVAAKITFISGKLAGQEFQIKEKGYDHSKKQFTIIPYKDERGQKFPTEDNTAFQFAVGDKYKLTEINPPQSVVDDAEEDLWFESIQDFNNMKQARVKYTLTLDRLYMINNTIADASTVLFKVGDYVHVKDRRFGIDKNIRVTKVSRNLLLRQDYSITLSDTVTISVAAQTVIDVIEHENIIEANRLRDLTRARKSWRTTEELRNMVYDADGYFDPENIKPNSIDTNMLTVGSKSQQFILSGVVLEANHKGNPNLFKATGGILTHLTINSEAIRNWTMSEAQFTLANTNGYYVFARCSKTGETGVWFVSQDKLLVENASDPDNYYFQVGILSAVYADDGFRDFVSTYGFTRINGNTITTGRIVTSDGENYLDLDGNKFRIGDSTSSVDWNVTAQNQLTLHNVRLLSDSGDTAPIGVYRGLYNVNNTYYYGDEVSYTSDGETKTYRHTNKTHTKGVAPTNSIYWNVIAKGANGKNGDYFEHRYAVNGSMVNPPTLTASSRNPSGWTTNQPAIGAMQYLWRTMAKISGADGSLIQNWSAPVRITPKDGDHGLDALSINISSTNICVHKKNERQIVYVRIKISKGNTLLKYDDDYKCSALSKDRNIANGLIWGFTTEEDRKVFCYRLMLSANAVVNTEIPFTIEDKKTGIIYPYQLYFTTIEDGAKGDPGDSPAIVYRGAYNPTSVYYGNRFRLDVVKHKESYYITRIDAGEFYNIIPSDASKWNQFGAQFESIATGLLLAENANIAGWIFKDGMLYSQNGNSFLNGVTGEVCIAGILRKKMVHITKDNIGIYTKKIKGYWNSINFEKAGSLISVDYQPPRIEDRPICYLPSVYPDVNHPEEQRDEARSYIGSTIIIFNKSNYTITLSGRCKEKDDGGSLSFALNNNEMAVLECKIRFDNQGREEVYWLFRRGKINR